MKKHTIKSKKARLQCCNTISTEDIKKAEQQLPAIKIMQSYVETSPQSYLKRRININFKRGDYIKGQTLFNKHYDIKNGRVVLRNKK